MTDPTDPTDIAAMREAAARIARTAADDPLFDHENGFVRRIGSWIALRIEALPVSTLTDTSITMREAAAAAVEKRAIELDRKECCGRGVLQGFGEEPSECCGDPVYMISNEEAAATIRALPAAQPDQRRSEAEIWAEIARMEKQFPSLYGIHENRADALRWVLNEQETGR